MNPPSCSIAPPNSAEQFVNLVRLIIELPVKYVSESAFTSMKMAPPFLAALTFSNSQF